MGKPSSTDPNSPKGCAGALAACDPEWSDKQYKNVDHVQVGDSPELVAAKTRYNVALRDMQAQQGMIADHERSEKELQQLYDNTPGPVDKIEVKWKLTTAKQMKE